ncbi:MAG: methyl-accepting chemotaxis protein, partial [Planctomyces sp.]
LLADILPPPEYVVETHLAVHEILDAAAEGTTSDLTPQLERLKTLEKEFEDRGQHWNRTLNHGSPELGCFEKLRAPASTYYIILRERFLPALSNSQLPVARRILKDELNPLYEKHRASVDHLTQIVRENVVRSKDEVDSLTSYGITLCLSVGGIIVLVTGLIGIRIVRGTITPISARASLLERHAVGAVESAQSIAAAVHQLEDSIREIHQNTNEAEKVCSTARNSVQSTSGVLRELSTSSTQIGEVIELIRRITHQTNLLALNATIEAARAGDSGRGFAVVAREVKELATQTNQAAGTIIEHIEKIRSETHTALSSMETVNEIVSAIHQSQVTIASAVNQQSDMTLQLSRSMSMMADTNQEITTTVQGLLNESAAVRRHSKASSDVDRTLVF